MALDVNRIVTALAAQIQVEVNREVNVYSGLVPGTAVPPCILIVPAEDFIDYHVSFGSTGLAEVNLRVQVVTPAGPGVDGQVALYEFFSAGAGLGNSVLDAVYTDKTLDGVVEHVHVTGSRWTGPVVWGAPDAQVSAVVAELILVARTKRAV